MRKILPLLIIAFLAVTYSTAQDIDKHSIQRFGFKLGMNYSSMNFNKGYPRPDRHVAGVWMTGITVGFLLEVPLSDNLSLNPEYAYSRMRGKDNRSNTTYKLNYLSMPVLLKYKVTQVLAIKAGPQFDLLINAKQSNSINSDITHDTEERNLGATACIEVKLAKSIYLEARYMQGLNHVGIGQRSNTTEFIYQLVQVNTSFKF